LTAHALTQFARRIAPAAVLATLAVGLAGCFGNTEPGTASASTPLGQFLRGSVQEPQEVDPNLYKQIVRCPPVTIRQGTETHVIFKGGKPGDPSAVGFQATLTESARECALEGDNMRIRVGVGGRVLAGRKGGGGAMALPVRIAVVKDGETPVYSKLHTINATLTPPEASVSWAFVDRDVVVPNVGVLRIFVGFDDGGKGGRPQDGIVTVDVQ
jgi:hypothetical protein